jgi:hypothetical protein
MALKSYMAMALFFCGAAWLWATGSQKASAERQAVASKFSLGAQQMIVYDRCIGAMEHKGLRAGGSKQQFCGCLTQRGLSDLRPDESDAILGWIEHGTPKPAMVTDRQIGLWWQRSPAARIHAVRGSLSKQCNPGAPKKTPDADFHSASQG